MAAKLVGHLLVTTPKWGGEVHWGICERCGGVEELTALDAEQWQRVGYCDVCVEEGAAEAAQEERMQWTRL